VMANSIAPERFRRKRVNPSRIRPTLRRHNGESA
jgi:hypothetical protein